MATVISSDRLMKHNIDKYNFKILAMGGNVDESNLVPVENENASSQVSQASETGDSSAMSSNSKESLIESLMKKTDEMSSNFIKLQMKLESMTQEHKDELIKVKEESLNEGMVLGKKELEDARKQDVKDEFAQLLTSVVVLDNSAKEYVQSLDSIKNELLHAALDISKEVVGVELSENSTDIAELLSNELIKDLQGASKITLRVNPKNHGEISQSIGSLEHITIVSDSAISEGGVVAISDVGNIDAQISKRFQRVKKAALSE